MIIGASRNPYKFGHRAVLAFTRQGHTVLPVNPTADVIAGVRCYRSIADVPGPIDQASLYLHPEQGADAVRDLAKRGDVRELWLNPGAESDELVELAQQLGFNPIQACSIVAIGERP